MLRRVALLCCLLPLAFASSAVAQSPAGMVDELLREQSCQLLAVSTVGVPDLLRLDPASSAMPADWPLGDQQRLPTQVPLRTSTTSFNRLFEFALDRGRLFARGRGSGDPWRQVPLPPCIDGRLSGIAADDDELVALDGGRRIFTMDNALKDPHLWNWSGRWGTPFWLGPGYAVPETVAWSWTVISKLEDDHWTDPAGNRTTIGDGKVSHIWGIRPGGQRLTFWDPWLPRDESYEMCGPQRGRLRMRGLSTSGSTVFVVGVHGDLFTRLFDFDISGMDPVFFRYSYDDQRGRGAGAPIQLPAEPWRRQPKVPGEITDAISVHKVGTGGEHRILRVEGRRDGRTGYWERDTADPAAAPWRFHVTGLPLRGRPLDNPPGDSSTRDLGPSEDERWTMRGPGVEATLEDFNVYCSPATLRIREGGHQRTVTLHHLDGLRQQVRGRGIDDTPREQFGAIEGPRGRFEPVSLRITREELVLVERGWRFRPDPRPAPATPAAPTEPRCLPRRLGLGARALGPLRLGRRWTALAAATPPAAIRRGGVRSWCVEGGGRVSARIAGGRLALVASTARGHLPRLRRGAPRIGRDLRRIGTRRVVAVRGGRVRLVAVVDAATIRRPERLRAALRQVGVGRWR